VPLWADVRPLRGAAGLLDWRLNGRLSRLLREGRLEGVIGEKLLFFTTRVPWRRVLTIGLGATTSFSEDAFRTSLGAVLDASAAWASSRRGWRRPAATWIASRQSELCAYSSRLPSSAKSNTRVRL